MNKAPLLLLLATSTTVAADELNQVVFRPLDKVIKNEIVKKHDRNGNPCFVDTTRLNEPGYFGPIGGLTYKVTRKGIYTYPDTGDYFGGKNGENSCEMNHAMRYTETEFEAITVFDGWDGLVGCALTGCTYNDLNGFYTDDYYDYDRRKYRSVANQFDPQTRIAIQKTKGLGPAEGVPHTNRAEYIWFSYPASRQQTILMEGFWVMTTYTAKGPQKHCLKIGDNQVWKAKINGTQCPQDRHAYQDEVTGRFGDMWWLANESSASLAQLNSMVKWGPQRYTSWEYQPTGEDWQQGILYRLEQTVSGTEVSTYRISELQRVN